MNISGNVVIKKSTLNCLVEKYFTRPNKAEKSEKYKTFFPAMKYHTQLSGEIDAIRINKECFTNKSETFFCSRASYWNIGKTKHYRVICIHPNNKIDRSARCLSDIIPAPILRAIGWAEDFKSNGWVKNAKTISDD